MEKQRRTRAKIKNSTPHAGNETAAAKQRPTRPKLRKPPPLRGPFRPRADFRRLGPHAHSAEEAKFSRIRRTQGISSIAPPSTNDATGGDISGLPGFHTIPLRSKPADRLGDIRRPAPRPSTPEKGGSSQNSAQSAEFQRSRHLLGWVIRYFAPHGSVGGRVEISTGNLQKSRRFADPPYGRFRCEGARFGEIPRDLPKFRENATYLV